MDSIFSKGIREADEFYALRLGEELSPGERSTARQAYAGLLWSKQFYYFVAEEWLAEKGGDGTAPPAHTQKQRHWKHLFCRDVLSMPDKWE